MTTSKTLKTALVGALAFSSTLGSAQAQDRVVDTTMLLQAVTAPGYGEMVDSAPVPLLDEAVALGDQFEQTNNFMSHQGVYRYAFYQKTGIWLSPANAEDEMKELEW